MGTQLPSPKRGRSSSIFGPCLLWSNGWMDQDGTLHGGGPRSRPYCARWEPSSPTPKKGAQPPNVYCGQRSPVSATAEHLLIIIIMTHDLRLPSQPKSTAATTPVGTHFPSHRWAGDWYQTNMLYHLSNKPGSTHSNFVDATSTTTTMPNYHHVWPLW